MWVRKRGGKERERERDHSRGRRWIWNLKVTWRSYEEALICVWAVMCMPMCVSFGCILFSIKVVLKSKRICCTFWKLLKVFFKIIKRCGWSIRCDPIFEKNIWKNKKEYPSKCQQQLLLLVMSGEKCVAINCVAISVKLNFWENVSSLVTR